LLVASRDMRGQLIDLIEHESTFGSEGRITAKMNSVGDPEMVEALYAASNAGVQIDLVVRGICCLRPGVPGMSENIRVRSILGRFLEHSRIIRFGHGDEGGPLYLIGSADWMPRNLDRRIEVLVPVEHPKHEAWLEHVFTTLLDEEVVRWEMSGDGSWQRHGPELFTEGDAQERFYQWVADRQRR
jgi:polyphosphate kinase